MAGICVLSNLIGGPGAIRACIETRAVVRSRMRRKPRSSFHERATKCGDDGQDLLYPTSTLSRVVTRMKETD